MGRPVREAPVNVVLPPTLLTLSRGNWIRTTDASRIRIKREQTNGRVAQQRLTTLTAWKTKKKPWELEIVIVLQCMMKRAPMTLNSRSTRQKIQWRPRQQKSSTRVIAGFDRRSSKVKWNIGSTNTRTYMYTHTRACCSYLKCFILNVTLQEEWFNDRRITNFLVWKNNKRKRLSRFF